LVFPLKAKALTESSEGTRGNDRRLEGSELGLGGGFTVIEKKGCGLEVQLESKKST